MSIKIVKGDLIKSMLDGELQAYGQQCNCFCRMGRGIAPLLVKANPEVLEVDKLTEEGSPYKLGTFSVTKDESKPFVYNLYGQFHWSKFKIEGKRNTDYSALESALEKAFSDMWSRDIKTLGLPLIGCGLAGGDWNIVRTMIENLSDWFEVDVTVFVLEDKYLEGRCTDTNSKGKIIFQTKSGVYVPVTLEECREAITVFEEAITYVEGDNPRKQIDARKY